ncbi:MAG: GNAT family N-acetyltransferase [Acidimicrobiales bacterium]|jgi:ribosomal protein S18 acetylase RimI-like enzyme
MSTDNPVSTDVRAAVPGDIPAVLDLWRQAAAPTSTDSPEALRLLLDRDPGALVVAESSGQIVGSVIAGWDGWRGSVYRLAVAPAHRRSGLGGRLLREAERRLRALGATRMHAIVVGSDSRAVAFWESTDWEHQSGQRRYTAG